MSGFCSMKRFTFASTTWGSKAQPANRTAVWAPAARGRPTAARPRLPARPPRKRRRETGGVIAVSFWARSALDRAGYEALHDEALEDEGQHERGHHGEHAAGGHERPLGRDVGGEAGDDDRRRLGGHRRGEDDREQVIVPRGH